MSLLDNAPVPHAAAVALIDGKTGKPTTALVDFFLRLTRHVAGLGQAVQKAAAPTAADIPAGSFAVWKDTAGGTVKLIYNDAGTLKSVTLT